MNAIGAQYGYTAGVWGGYHCECIAISGGGTPEPTRFRTRGPARSCGDGPWFTATKNPSGYIDDKGQKHAIVDQPFKKTGNEFCYSWHYADSHVCLVYGNVWGGIIQDIDIPESVIEDGVVKFHYKYTTVRISQNEISTVYGGWWTPGAFTPDSVRSNSEHLLATKKPETKTDTWRVAVRNGKIVDSAAWKIASFDATISFKYGELQAFTEAAEFGWIRYDLAGYFNMCYVDAVNSLPQAGVNLMANILETVSAIKALIEGIKSPLKGLIEFAKGFSDPRDVWLKHRYVITTTKLDVQEYIALNKRLAQLSKLCAQNIHCNATYAFGDESVGVQLDIPLSQALPEGLQNYLRIVGLNPSPSNFWDIVPYSFVVDWFLDISGILKWYEGLAYSLNFQPHHVWFTYKSQYDNQFIYYRVPGRKLDIPPTYVRKEASSKTIRMRIADAISLFT